MMLVLLEERISLATHLAGHDTLTGLPNRRLYADRFEQAVAQAIRDNGGFGFLVIDLNRFKQVNDALGQSLEAPILIAEGPYHVSASVGAAVYPADGLSESQLHAVADERMYAGKEQHRIESARHEQAINHSNRA
ncbi:diguanylate cyclase domain-containing protein [Chromobacterium sphagni]|nr:GGDEF domain-containing protein [Chromobacterium sphagni]